MAILRYLRSKSKTAMKNNPITVFLLLIFCCSTGLIHAQSGAAFLFEVLDEKEKVIESYDIKTDGANIQWKGKNQDTDSDAAGATDMIFRADAQELVLINSKSKSYQVMNEATINSIKSSTDATRKQVEESMKNLPPEARAKLMEMQKNGNMAGLSIPGVTPQPIKEVSTINTGTKATKAGFPCTLYKVIENGETAREVWVTPWSNLKGEKEFKGALKKMEAFFQKIMEAFPGDFQQNSYLFEGLNEWEGFPVLVTDLKNNRTTQLKSAKKEALTKADFAPPATFKQQTLAPLKK